MKQFIFISGLPRTGSTLLTAILSQNPNIYSEGNSAVCQIMYDMNNCCLYNANEQLIGNKRQKKTTYDLQSQIPYIYYKDVKEPIILDKCRAWMQEENIQLIKDYIHTDFKMIILERNITDIIKSFARLYYENNINYDLLMLFTPNTHPVMNPIFALKNLKENITEKTTKNFLFINYEELVNETENTIKKIYEFCDWEPFIHDFKNVVVKYPEDDLFYGIKGMHYIKPVVKKQPNPIEIPESVLSNCIICNKLLGYV